MKSIFNKLQTYQEKGKNKQSSKSRSSKPNTPQSKNIKKHQSPKKQSKKQLIPNHTNQSSQSQSESEMQSKLRQTIIIRFDENSIYNSFNNDLHLALINSINDSSINGNSPSISPNYLTDSSSNDHLRISLLSPTDATDATDEDSLQFKHNTHTIDETTEENKENKENISPKSINYYSNKINNLNKLHKKTEIDENIEQNMKKINKFENKKRKSVRFSFDITNQIDSINSEIDTNYNDIETPKFIPNCESDNESSDLSPSETFNDNNINNNNNYKHFNLTESIFSMMSDTLEMNSNQNEMSVTNISDESREIVKLNKLSKLTNDNESDCSGSECEDNDDNTTLVSSVSPTVASTNSRWSVLSNKTKNDDLKQEYIPINIGEFNISKKESILWKQSQQTHNYIIGQSLNNNNDIDNDNEDSNNCLNIESGFDCFDNDLLTFWDKNKSKIMYH